MSASASKIVLPVPQETSSGFCVGCPDEDKCRRVWSQPHKGPLNAAGLVISSGLAFLLPLLTAIMAGAVVHSFKDATNHVLAWEIGAALAGLLVGAMAAWSLMPLLRKRFYEPKSRQNHRRP